MIAHLSDRHLEKLPRGGHDYKKLYAAYKAAIEPGRRLPNAQIVSFDDRAELTARDSREDRPKAAEPRSFHGTFEGRCARFVPQ